MASYDAAWQILLDVSSNAFKPHFLSQVASHDVASTICQGALLHDGIDAAAGPLVPHRC